MFKPKLEAEGTCGTEEIARLQNQRKGLSVERAREDVIPHRVAATLLTQGDYQQPPSPRHKREQTRCSMCSADDASSVHCLTVTIRGISHLCPLGKIKPF